MKREDTKVVIKGVFQNPIFAKILIEMSAPLSEQEQFRRQSLEAIRKMGINPYPQEEVKITHYAAGIKSEYEEGAEGWRT